MHQHMEPNNVQPHYRRATAIAMAFVAANAGGKHLSSLSFLQTDNTLTASLQASCRHGLHDSPRFHKASVINIVFTALSSVLSIAIVLYLRRRIARSIKKLKGCYERRARTEPVAGIPWRCGGVWRSAPAVRVHSLSVCDFHLYQRYYKLQPQNAGRPPLRLAELFLSSIAHSYSIFAILPPRALRCLSLHGAFR